MMLLSPFMRELAYDFFRAEGPMLSESYRRTVRVAGRHGWFVPGVKEAGRTIRALHRDPAFRAYRKPGGGCFVADDQSALVRNSAKLRPGPCNPIPQKQEGV